MDANKRYQIIKKLVDSNGNKQRALNKLTCSRQHLNRMIQGYNLYGKAFFVHGNKGRKPAIAIPEQVKQDVLYLYKDRYYGANFKHFTELLATHHKITLSPASVRAILTHNDIISPLATRQTKRDFTAKLKAQKQATTSPKKIAELQEKLDTVDLPHPRRPRAPYFGQMIQMDASEHNWFESGKKAFLHAAIDDATSTVVGLYFDTQETLNGYYHVTKQILSSYGVPELFYTDRRTVFEYKLKRDTSLEKDYTTQFAYACMQLGIELKTTSVPQAKGRVERLFGTLQSRLPIEFRQAGVRTIDQANVFLKTYVKKHNNLFALDHTSIESTFDPKPSDEHINLTLAVLTQRVIGPGHCIRFKNSFFLPHNSKGSPVHLFPKAKALVIQALDGSLFASVNDRMYALKEVPKHETPLAHKTTLKQPVKPKKIYIPPMAHPWRISSFGKFAQSQSHRQYLEDF